MKSLLKKSIDKSISYEAYNKLFESLVEEGKTTGENQSEDYVHYTKMNLSRTKRVEKKLVPGAELKMQIQDIQVPLYILTITEAWCGDAAQIVPAVHTLIKDNRNLEMRVILRDEHSELMNHFMTNGGKAIPIFVFVSKETGELLGHWGARPDSAQEIVEDYKKLTDKPPYSVLSENLQKWYNEDKGLSTYREFSKTLLSALKVFNNRVIQP